MKFAVVLLFIALVFGQACVDFGSNVASALCSPASKLCVVHRGVCNAMAAVLASNMPSAGWTIYFSATTYSCSLTSIADCSNVTAVSRAVLSSGPVLYTLPTHSYVYNINGVTFAALPSASSVTLTTPAVVNRGGGCSVFVLRASNIHFMDISLDATPCIPVYSGQTAAIILSDASNLSITNMNVYGAPVLVGVSYSGSFGVLQFSGFVYMSGYSGIFTRCILARIAVYAAGLIVVPSPSFPYPILTATSAPAVTISPPNAVVVWNILEAFENMALEPLDYTDAAASSSIDYDTTDNPYLIVVISFCVAFIVFAAGAALSHLNAARDTRAVAVKDD
jgi:hypothetical protein